MKTFAELAEPLRAKIAVACELCGQPLITADDIASSHEANAKEVVLGAVERLVSGVQERCKWDPAVVDQLGELTGIEDDVRAFLESLPESTGPVEALVHLAPCA